MAQAKAEASVTIQTLFENVRSLLEEGRMRIDAYPEQSEDHHTVLGRLNTPDDLVMIVSKDPIGVDPEEMYNFRMYFPFRDRFVEIDPTWDNWATGRDTRRLLKNINAEEYRTLCRYAALHVAVFQLRRLAESDDNYLDEADHPGAARTHRDNYLDFTRQAEETLTFINGCEGDLRDMIPFKKAVEIHGGGSSSGGGGGGEDLYGDRGEDEDAQPIEMQLSEFVAQLTQNPAI